MQKLQAYPRQHLLTRALQEYGRLIKTIHILRWYADDVQSPELDRDQWRREMFEGLVIAIGQTYEQQRSSGSEIAHSGWVTNRLPTFNPQVTLSFGMKRGARFVEEICIQVRNRCHCRRIMLVNWRECWWIARDHCILTGRKESQDWLAEQVLN